MNRLQNFSLRLFFWALINRDVSCRCKVESRWVGLMLVLSQLSSAVPLCLSCCPSSSAEKVSVLYSLLNFGFLPCSSSVYLYFQMSLLLAHHLSWLYPWLMGDSCICPTVEEGRGSERSSREGKVGGGHSGVGQHWLQGQASGSSRGSFLLKTYVITVTMEDLIFPLCDSTF